MIKINKILFVYLAMIHSCIPVRVYAPPNEIYHKNYELSVKLLEVKEEKENHNNRLIISYEIINNSGFLYENLGKKHYVFFTIKTTDGKEISDYERIYKIINPHQSIIAKKYIDISTYEYTEVEAYIQN